MTVEPISTLSAATVFSVPFSSKVAASGRWIVAEDVKNHRLLRFRVETKRGGAR